jgi:hypothetical protein
MSADHSRLARIRVDEQWIELPFPAKFVLDLGLLVVALLDPDANLAKFGQFRNLLGLRRSGEIIWTAELPTSTTGDCYLAVDQDSADRLRARSFSSFDVVIDALTGAIESKEFTK